MHIRHAEYMWTVNVQNKYEDDDDEKQEHLASVRIEPFKMKKNLREKR